MDMVEKVARAICCPKGCRTEAVKKVALAEHGVYLTELPCNWPVQRDEARAAIEAMREPTSEMYRAGAPYVTGYEDMRSVSECWSRMIDAALSLSEGEGA